mmetsp:Transcript_88947/g.235295  ORF Transcript_88947/g.235295 Transcript_88947/m.235295 type:complete len:362 (-) Transcript_88947:91-1176(-)
MSVGRSVRPCGLLHVAVGADAGAAPGRVLAHDCIEIRVGPRLQRFLGSRDVPLLAHPSHDARLLQGLAVREGEVPGHLVLEELVHHVQVDGCYLLVVLVQGGLARQEEYTGQRRRHCAKQRLHCERGDCFGVSPRAADAVLHHVRLQEAALQVDVVIRESLELGGQHPLGHRRTVCDVVLAVGNNLWLNDRHQLLALADGRVARQGVHRIGNGEVAGQTCLGVLLEDVAPLGKTGSLRVGLRAPLLEVVEANGGDLGVAQRPYGSAPHALLVVGLVHLDAWDHSVPGDYVHHRLPRGVLLEESLPVQDHTADVLAQARGAEAHGAVCGTVLDDVGYLRRLGVAGAQPRARGLIGSKEPLPG